MLIIIGAIIIAFPIFVLGWIVYFEFIEPALDKWLEKRENKCYNNNDKKDTKFHQM